MYLFRDVLPKLKGNLRFIHAVPGGPAVDIYASGSLLASNVAFSDISSYMELSPGIYNIQIYKAGTYDAPLLSKDYEVIPNTFFTISVIVLEGSITLFSLKDASSVSTVETAFLRFINLSPTAPLLTLSLSNGDILFNSVEYVETTGYYPLSSGIYNLLVSAAGASAINKFIKDINLKPGEFDTIYIIGQADGQPKLGYLSTKDGK